MPAHGDVPQQQQQKWRRIFTSLRNREHLAEAAAAAAPHQQQRFDQATGRFYGRLTKAVSREASLRGEGFTAQELRAAARERCDAVRLFKEHDYTLGAVGQLLSAEFNEHDQFLYVHGQVDLSHPLGQEVYAALKSGDLRHLSVGFAHPAAGTCDEDPSRYYNRLVEASFVQQPHQPLAEVLECHSKEQRARETLTFVCSTATAEPLQRLFEYCRRPHHQNQVNASSSTETETTTMSSATDNTAASQQQPPASSSTATAAANSAQAQQDARRVLQDTLGMTPDQIRSNAELQGRLAAMIEQQQKIAQQLSAERQAREEAERKAREASEDLTIIAKEYEQSNATRLKDALEFVTQDEKLQTQKPVLERFLNMAYTDRKNKEIAEFVSHTVESLRSLQSKNSQLQQTVQQLSGSQSAYGEALAAQAAQQAYQQQHAASSSGGAGAAAAHTGNFAPANHPIGAAMSAAAGAAGSPMVVTQHAAGAQTVPASMLPGGAASQRAPSKDVVVDFLQAVNSAKRRVFEDAEVSAPKVAANGATGSDTSFHRTLRGTPTCLLPSTNVGAQ